MSVEDLEEVWERAITVARVEHSNRCSEIPCTAKLGFSIGSCSRSHEAREQGEDMCPGTGLFERKIYHSTSLSGLSLLISLDHMVTLKKRPRHMVVVREVSKRLVELGRNEAAAEILRAADQPEEAVAVAIAGGAWDKARESAGGHASLVTKA